MLRPATPLTVLYFIAFVLLVLATISTPIVKGIPIASVGGVNFGVFGYCTPTACSKIGIGYTVDAKTVFGNPADNSDFSIPTGTRSSLSSILIVHPVAAFLNLICLILSATAHLHSPSHSPRYLLALLILSIPTLLITLLAFLVDILLFVPHLAWGGWIVLGSTILILASGIVTCAMRRTLVSRKARKKRIAENADMNGQNYYATQMAEPTGVGRAESPPPLASGGIGQSDTLPKFATFGDSKSVHVSEDQIPLNRRTPSNKTIPSAPGSGNGSGSRGPGYQDDGFSRYDGPGRGGRGGMRGGPVRGGFRGGFGGPRDEYGNPLPPSNAFGPMPPAGMSRDRSAPPMTRHQYSDEAMGPVGARGRGRGGYGPPRGYGRGGPHLRGRGGYGRGGMPMGGARGPPLPGYGNPYPPVGRPGQYDGPGGPAGYGRSPSAPAYTGRGPSPGQGGGYGRRSPSPPSAPGGHDRGPTPGGGYGYDSAEPGRGPPPQGYGGDSPPHGIPASYLEDAPIGQAVEMDAIHGAPSPIPPFTNSMGVQDMNGNDQDFMDLQQPPKHRNEPMSMGSVYSADAPYVPPRAAWQVQSTARGMTPPPNTTAPDPHTVDPVELPVQSTARQDQQSAPSHARNASDNYYEDVAPQFASPTSPVEDAHHLTQQAHLTQLTQSSATVPVALMPGLHKIPDYPVVEHSGEIINPTGSYDDLPEGQQSPASDHSNMTSISQRGVNPNWRPGSTDLQGNLAVPQHRAVQQQRDMLLKTNPDFELNARGGAGNRMPVGMGQAF